MSQSKARSLLLLISLLLLAGCAQKTKIAMLQPAEIDIKAKNIAVLPFKNDRKIGLSGKLESALSNVRFNGKPYFNVVDRRNIDSTIKEQKRQSGGLYNENSEVEIGSLMGASALISGAILNIGKQDQRHREDRRKCEKKSCHDYTVSCTTRNISLSANIRITNVTLGTVPYSDSITRSFHTKHCSDDTVMLPSKEQGAQQIAQSIAQQFIFKLKPNYVNIQVTLLDSADLDYTDHEESLLKNGLKYLTQKRLDKAEQLLSNLLTSTQFKSYVAAYNLGVVNEAKGDLAKAAEYYTLADRLQIEPIDEINQAVIRIQNSLVKNKQAQGQVNRNLSK